MLRQIFYFDKLDLWDKYSIVVYLTLSAICGYFFLNENSSAANRSLLLFYTMGTQLLLYLLNYKSLRNLKVYLIWIFISLLHLFAFYQLKNRLELQNVHGHAANGLRNTIFLLLLYQVLRITSLKTQKQELVAPVRGSTTDLFEGRSITFIDFALFVVYFAAIIVLNV